MCKQSLFTLATIALSTVGALTNSAERYGRSNFRPSIFSHEHCTNDSEIIERLLSTYNRNKVPGGRASVELEVWVQEITSISDITSDFNIDLYVTELWLDPALTYSHMNPCKQNLSLNNELLKHLWTPNSCFINSKSAEIHESPFPNIFLLVYPNGTVWTNYRLTLTGPCIMDLTAFPFDTVKCHLTFESFNYNIDEVSMSWTQVGVDQMRDNMELADYTLESIISYRNEVVYPAGNWHELTMQFQFKRRPGWYILQAYLPTFLTIFISWIAFCLGTKAIPARTMLGVNALLAMTFQFGNVIRNLPRVSYVKAIDVWMLSCMTFVFCSLLELAWIGYLSRKSTGIALSPEKKKKVERKRIKHAKKKYKKNSIACNDKTYGTMNRSYAEETPLPLQYRLYQNAVPIPGESYGYRPPGLHRLVDANYATYNAVPPLACKCHHKQPAIVHPSNVSEHGEPKANDDPSADGGQLSYNDKLALKIDHISCFVFPTLFVLFNIFYWCYYLSQK